MSIPKQWFLFPKPIKTSKVARLVDQYGSAVILKNNSPRYLILEFNQADEQLSAQTDDVLAISEKLITRNKAVYEELAK